MAKLATIDSMGRGARRPYSVWIETRRDGGRRRYRVRWINPKTGAVESQNCGAELIDARDARDAKVTELRTGGTGRHGYERVSDLRERIGDWMTGKAPATIAITRRALDRLVRLCGDLRLRYVTRAELMDFRAAVVEELAQAATNKDLRAIKSALSYAVDAGWMSTNPAWRWKGMELREPETETRVVEPDEFAAILAASEDPDGVCFDSRMSVLLTVAYYQGLRRRELIQLHWDDVNLRARELRVVNRTSTGELTKSRKNRVLPMRAAVRDALASWLDMVPKVAEGRRYRPKFAHVLTWPDGRPLGPTWVSRAFRALVEASGVSPCTLHDFRRSWSTLAQRAGVNPAIVQELGGWSALSVVRAHYTGDVSAAHRQATDLLDASAPVLPPDGRPGGRGKNRKSLA